MAGQELPPFRFELTRGATVSGTVTDPDGKPVQNAIVVSRLQCDSSALRWRGAFEPVFEDGKFEVHGLESGAEYPLFFVDLRRKLGATAIVKAETREPSVVLQPCGTATARFVDQDGQPIAEQVFGLSIVVTPGKPRLVRLPMQGPEFLSDGDFYSNCIQMRRNGREPEMTDANGVAMYEWLIPGATYRRYRGGTNGLEVAAEFTVEPGETRDLGEVRMRTTLDARFAADRINDVVSATGGAAPYPQTELAGRLQTVSQLIKAGFETPVYYAIHGGYDTHAAQLPSHGRLLRELAGAVQSFLDDLKASGLSDRVLVLGFSEFGRRVEENGSLGTDHGTAGPVFLAGAGVRAGLHAATPSLTELEDGDLKMSVDFRSVYATILSNWLRVDPHPVLGGEFQSLDVLAG